MLRLLGVLLGNWDFFASVMVMVGHWEHRGWFRGGGEAERVAANMAGWESAWSGVDLGLTACLGGESGNFLDFLTQKMSQIIHRIKEGEM